MPPKPLATFLSNIFHDPGGVNPAFARDALPAGVRMSRFPTTDCMIVKF